MTSPAQAGAIDVVINIVLDTIQPFIERLVSVENRVDGVESVLSVHDGAEIEALYAPQRTQQTQGEVITPERPSQPADDRTAAIQAVLDLHRLEASPAQWSMDRSGKRVPAPEGAWELSCSGCNYTTVWVEGDPPARGCKTRELLS